MAESKSNTVQQASGKPASGQVIQVPAPAGGVQEHVTSSPAGELILGFDPSTATATRPEGSNDLVFALDGGGIVTVTDFFVVGDESLPNLRLPDGAVVASADFFADSELDMTTAAGATAAPPSGGSDGSGDPLSMTTGVEALDDQDTWYWDWASTFSDIYEGLEFGEEPASGLSIIGMVPGNPGYAAGPGRPDNPNVPDDPDTPGGPATYYLDASGYNLEIQESFMKGGTDYEDLGDPAYTMEFLITVTDDMLSGISIGGTLHTVAALANGVTGDLFTDGPGVFANAQLFPAGEGRFVLRMEYRQSDAFEHAKPGELGDELANDASVIDIVVNTVSGARAAITGNVDIVDDVPVIEFVADSGDILPADGADVYTLDSGATVTGVIDYAGGADGAKSVEIDGFDLLTLSAAGGTKTFASDAGSLTVTRNGDELSYSYEAKASDKLGADRSDSFAVTITDKDGDIAADTLTLNVEAPFIASSTADMVVHESMLKHGTGKGEGATLTAEGELVVNEVTTSLEFNLSNVGVNDDAYTATVPLSDLIGASREAPYNVVGVPGLQITDYDAATGTVTYSYTLQEREEHKAETDPVTGAATNEHNIEMADTHSAPTLSIVAIDADGDRSAPAVTEIVVVDDIVSTNEISINVSESTTQNYCVTIILDLSGSMTFFINDNETRLDIAKDALKDLVSAYDNLAGKVVFNLVTFSGKTIATQTALTAEELLSTDTAQGIIDELVATPGGTTNYANALNDAYKAYTAANGILAQAGDEYTQLCYFISDGDPDNNSVGAAGFKGGAAYGNGEKGWQDFVNSNDIDVIPVGIGMTSPTQIAKTGNSGYAQEVMLVEDDRTALSEALLGTLPTSSQGNLIAQANVLGADNPLLTEMTYTFTDEKGDPIIEDGKPKTATIKFVGGDPNEELTLTLDQGVEITIKANGDYLVTVNGNKNVTDDITIKNLKYTVKDSDGDESSNVIARLVIHDVDPVAYDNIAVVDTYLAGEQLKAYDLKYGTTKDELARMNDEWDTVGGTIHRISGFNQADDIKLLDDGNGISLRTVGIDKDLTSDIKANQDALEGKLGTSLESLGVDMDGFTDGVLGATSVSVTADGIIQFNYTLVGGRDSSAPQPEGTSIAQYKYRYDDDQLFWVIKDADDTIVDSGVVAQGASETSRGVITSAPLGKGDYTLYIGVVNAGKDADGNVTSRGAAKINIDDIVVSSIGGAVYKGNFVNDESPTGQVDQMLDNAVVKSITHDGTTYVFGKDDDSTLGTDGSGYGAIVISLDGDNKAYFYANGAYEITTGQSDLRFSYTLADQDSGTSTAQLVVNPTVHAEPYAGGDGNDFIVGNDTGLELSGGLGEDTMYGGAGNDTLHGGDGKDHLHGGDGADILYGNAGDDIIYGNAGNDLLYGGQGNDTLVGGEGADTFAWTKADFTHGGTDTVMDFNVGAGDKLSFEDLFGAEHQELSDLVGTENLDVTVGDQFLTLKVTAEGNAQTIEVNFEGGLQVNGQDYANYTEFYTAYTNNQDNQGAMLVELLKVLSD